MVLIHSRLVGPSTWSALTPVAAAFGFDVATPNLTHLGILTDPGTVMGAIVDIIER